MGKILDIGEFTGMWGTPFRSKALSNCPKRNQKYFQASRSILGYHADSQKQVIYIFRPISLPFWLSQWPQNGINGIWLVGRISQKWKVRHILCPLFLAEIKSSSPPAVLYFQLDFDAFQVIKFHTVSSFFFAILDIHAMGVCKILKYTYFEI